MTLIRDGWLDGRPYAAPEDPDTGETLYLVCLKCEAEIEADPDVFMAHECENYREGPELKVTSAAEALADEEGVDLSEIEGSGSDGRITKADVEASVEED